MRDRQAAFVSAARRSMQETVAAINANGHAAERSHRLLATLHTAHAVAIIGTAR